MGLSTAQLTPCGRSPGFPVSRPEEQTPWEGMAPGVLFWKCVLLVIFMLLSFGLKKKKWMKNISFHSPQPPHSALRETASEHSEGFQGRWLTEGTSQAESQTKGICGPHTLRLPVRAPAPQRGVLTPRQQWAVDRRDCQLTARAICPETLETCRDNMGCSTLDGRCPRTAGQR